MELLLEGVAANELAGILWSQNSLFKELYLGSAWWGCGVWLEAGLFLEGFFRPQGFCDSRAESSSGKHLERTFSFHPCPWMNPIIVHPTSALSPALEWDGTSPCGIIFCLMLSQHLFQELFPLLSKTREFTSSFTQVHVSPEILFPHFPHETSWNHKSDLNVTCELQENLEHSHCF